jgi:hypothetical protein
LRRFLAFLIKNIILVVASIVIASKVARLYGLAFDYKRGIEELVGLFYMLVGR